MKSFRELLQESKQVDSVIAFSERMPSVAFYPNKPKSLGEHPKSPFNTFCLSEGGELRYYCVLHDNSKIVDDLIKKARPNLKENNLMQ